MTGPVPLDDPRLRALLASYTRCTGETLVARPEDLFELPQPVLSHGTEQPPVFWYGNRAALGLWEYDLASWTRLESRCTAEPDAREVREALLARVRAEGFTDGYTGVRISRTGRRFLIENAIVWNLVGDDGQHLGQAATFRTYTRLD